MNRRSLFSFVRSGALFTPREPELEVNEEPEELIDTKHTRRFFFGIMAGAAATAVVAPQIEKVIYDCPDCNQFLEPLGWADGSGNILLTRESVDWEILAILQRNATFARMVSRDQEFWNLRQNSGIGETLNIRKPRAFGAYPA